MIRPNMAQDAPPTEITVGGVSYRCETDYRAWIDIIDMLNNLLPDARNTEEAMHNAETIIAIEEAVFGKIIEAPAADVLRGITEFMKGYPHVRAEADDAEAGNGRQVYSFKHDINSIIIAIRNQSGRDIGYGCKEFHWWLFLEEFRNLCGDHYILRLMEIRGYDGNDAKMKAQSLRFAVPREQTAEDDRIVSDFNDIFYGA